MRLINFIICIFVVLFFASCSDPVDTTDTSPNKLVVATSADNPPYEFSDGGEIVGFDIDLAREIANQLGEELEIKNVDFNGLLPALITHNVDMVIAALTVTPERKSNVDFTTSYTSAEMAVIFRKDANINEDTDLTTKIIGAQFGTTWEDFANMIMEDSEKGSVKSLANNLQLIQELLNKNIDIVIMEKLQVEKFASENDLFGYFILPESRSEFSIALPKNSFLTEKIDDILERLKENGFLDSLKTKWLHQ